MGKMDYQMMDRLAEDLGTGISTIKTLVSDTR